MPMFPLQDLVRSVLAAHGEDAWTVEETGAWCYVRPPEPESRVQGWKLHLSATVLSFPHVLHRAAEVLVPAGCSFKFARDLDTAQEMISSTYDRAQCGKLITVYPRDDDQFRSLAKALDTATAGLPGPAILSDRPYRKGGLVHYRYGAFDGRRTLTNEGLYEVRLEAPDGTLVPDPRKPWFTPPPWAKPPFGGEPGRTAKPAAPEAVLLDDRFEVRQALRHSARGGVYRAVDRKTGEDVIVKQARAHVDSGTTGEDARALLRREGRMLARLDGLCPKLVHEFEQNGHAFLVEELVPGQPLLRWVQERTLAREDDVGVDPAEALEMGLALVGLLSEVHARGLVYQDFTPTNVMVTDEGRPVLIDPEWAAEPGTWIRRATTPGFAAPERVVAPLYGPAHGPEADLFALGAVLCHLVTGAVPHFARDEPGENGPAARTHSERIRTLLAAAEAQRPAARLLAPAVIGLTQEEPERRWTADRVRQFLTGLAPADIPVPAAPAHPPAPAAPTGALPAAATPNAAAPAAGAAACPSVAPAAAPAVSRVSWRPSPDERRRLVDDGLSHLLRDMADPATGPARLWSADSFGTDADPCALQHGSAGPLAVLVRADRLLGRADLRAGIERVARWTDERRARTPRVLPGLHFGASGTAWALHEAAVHLGDTALAERAVELALTVPVRWPNPDVCHGAAGAGLAQLRFWHATGRPEFLERVAECARGLVSAAERADGRVLWPVPEDFDSSLAGVRHLGFAHGVAGVGAFLLYAGLATGDRRCLDLAAEAGDTLVAEAERGPWGARWRGDIADAPGTGLLYHWCNGSSGVGTFLVRLWRATGGAPYLRLAEEAGRATHRVRWSSPSAACHGIAGNGHFLLDLAEAVPDGPYRDWAEDLAAVLHAHHAVRDGLRLVPDGTGQSFHADHQTGTSGTLDFLLRLDHGGPRSWLPDVTVTGAQESAGAPAPAAASTDPHERRDA